MVRRKARQARQATMMWRIVASMKTCRPHQYYCLRHACIRRLDYPPFLRDIYHCSTPVLFSHMPRLPPGLFAKANRQCPLLSQLLPTCRTLESAQAELRWLKQHAIKEAGLSNSNTRAEHGDLLESLVQRRARGEPLQYILGSEHFGDLEIRCRPGVLIPR